MDIRPLELSIVIVASDCNPTILNPDFLARTGIVPDDWGWKVAGPPITTPPFASVNYNSGVIISVESNKFNVVQRALDKEPDPDLIAGIAQRYIEVLPHVRYTGVGHNFKAFVEQADTEAFLKERFVKAGVWDSKHHALEAVSFTLRYPLQGGHLNVSLNGAAILDSSGDEPKQLHGVLVQANYHRDCPEYPSVGQVLQHVGHINTDWKHFQTTASEILG